MPVYGLLTQKATAAGAKWSNRYYISALSHSAAKDIGDMIIAGEKLFHGVSVLFRNVHVWVPGSTPRDFRNYPQTGAGDIADTTPTSGVPTVEIFLTPAGSSYPNYKRYRVYVNPDRQSGTQWSVAILSPLSDAVEAFSNYIGTFVTKGGDEIEEFGINPIVTYTQLGKEWHNRS